MTLKTKNPNSAPSDNDPQYDKLNRQAFLTLRSSTTGGYGRRIESSTKSDEYVESLYISCTEGLIGIIDGSIPVDSEDEHIPNEAHYKTSEFSGEPAEHVIYLDKSARPISFLVSELWESMAKPHSNEPVGSFVNIDKEKWLQLMGVPATRLQNPTTEDYDFSKIDPLTLRKKIAELRAIYVEDDYVNQIDENNPESVHSLPTVLDGKNVLIVDEVESSGYTLKIALQLFMQAFPEAKFGSAYWSSPSKIRWTVSDTMTESSEFASTWVPFWYDPKLPTGRGIGDIDPSFYEKSNDIRRRLGRFLLSAPFYRKEGEELITFTDRDSQETFNDLSILIEKFKKGKIICRPNSRRSDFEKKAVEINNLGSFDEYKGLIRKCLSA